MSNIQNLISVTEFSKQLRKNVPIGMNKIYEIVREKDFPSVKIGGRYYVLSDKIDEWLEKQIYKKE